MDPTDSLVKLFYEEAREGVEQIEQVLLDMDKRGADTEAINALFRHAHSLKGNSGVMGFTHISRFTHRLENALDVLRQGGHELTRPLVDMMLEAVDVIRRMLAASQTQGDVPEPACEPLIQRIDAEMRGVPGIPVSPRPPSGSPDAEAPTPMAEMIAASPDAARYRLAFSPGPAFDAEGDPIGALSELQHYATIRSCRLVETVPRLAELDATVCHLSWDAEVETASDPVILRAVLDLSSDGASTHITPIGDGAPAPEDAPGNEARATGMAEASAASAASEAHEDPTIATGDSPAGPHAAPIARQPAAQPALSAQGGPAQTGGAAQGRRRAEAQTIRVATEKVDALFNLTSEIVIAQSMLNAAEARIADADARLALSQMERHVRDLHERVMAIRMIPVGYVFSRFPRMVRDLAAAMQKDVRLDISGEETELDRTLLDALADPLTHLLRNSIDHGIEPPAERKAAGKPATGSVRLNAFQAEGRIHIEVADDGHGIDPERIHRKAVGLGWLREDERLSADGYYDLLFRPGFSTAEAVSDVSGRGVGMDVVKRNVETLGGMVSVQSELGQGSRFLIKVPLTLAIMDGLVLRVGEEHYILPLTSVMEAFQPASVLHCSALGSLQMVNVRGRFLPLTRLASLFAVPETAERTSQGLLVVLEQDEQQVAVLADEIVGQQQVVMKSLEANYARVPGFSGATILGDGRVALIIDVGNIVRRAQDASTAQHLREPAAA
ncbi:MAG TPA: chemotaxis protein CheA [Chthonomonadales bacterium]|nr:chemotaxis protein CheA [Chthonomonadales bacterium]